MLDLDSSVQALLPVVTATESVELIYQCLSSFFDYNNMYLGKSNGI